MAESDDLRTTAVVVGVAAAALLLLSQGGSLSKKRPAPARRPVVSVQIVGSQCSVTIDGQRGPFTPCPVAAATMLQITRPGEAITAFPGRGSQGVVDSLFQQLRESGRVVTEVL